MKLPWRHAIAYRLHMNTPQDIPLEAVDLRWSRLAHAIPKKAPFTYNCRNQATSVPRTQAARYNEVTRASRPLCSEIAEISDEEVFNDSLKFAHGMRYNARLQKRVQAGQGQNEKAHDKPNHIGVGSRSDQTELSQASQAHSLYSTELGHVLLFAATSVVLPEPRSDLHTNTPRADAVGGGHADANTQKRPCRSLALRRLPENTVGDDYDYDSDPSDALRINLNQRVAKVGHPRVDRAKVDSEVRQRQVIFNASSKTRRSNGNITLAELLDSFNVEKPLLENLQKRLSASRSYTKHLRAVARRCSTSTTQSWFKTCTTTCQNYC